MTNECILMMTREVKKNSKFKDEKKLINFAIWVYDKYMQTCVLSIEWDFFIISFYSFHVLAEISRRWLGGIKNLM